MHICLSLRQVSENVIIRSLWAPLTLNLSGKQLFQSPDTLSEVARGLRLSGHLMWYWIPGIKYGYVKLLRAQMGAGDSLSVFNGATSFCFSNGRDVHMAR